MAKSKGWPKIGTIRKSDNTGNLYIKLEENVQLMVDGEVVKLNDSKTVSLQKPQDKLDSLYERDFLSEKEYNERSEKLAANSWLKYEIVAPPAKS